MQSYNAFAEQRIDDLIKQAEDEQEIGIVNEILKSASDILRKSFNSHPRDSHEDTIRRLNSKNRIYQNILGAYDGIIEKLPEIPDEDVLSQLNARLKEI